MEENNMEIGDVFHDRHLNVHCSSWGILLNMSFVIEQGHHSWVLLLDFFSMVILRRV